MTLSRKLTYKLIALAGSLVVLCAASLWGLSGLRKDVDRARDEYKELRIIQDVDIHVGAIRGMLASGALDEPELAANLRGAIERLEFFLAFQDTQVGADPQHQARELEAATNALIPLRAFLDDAANTPEELGARRPSHAAAIERMFEDLERLALTMDGLIEEAHHSASVKLRRTIAATAAMSLVIVAVAILINVSQYRSVMRPLNRLREAVHRIAGGEFGRVAEVTGDVEFAELARDFNRMAAELDSLYRDLEAKVRTKSKELVRSERLASVGFLAAGVAHEINNPLNIISGYAELSLKHLRQSRNGPVDDELRRSLEIVLEEAFRCKRITEQLLSLARTEAKERRPLSVPDLLRDVSTMVAGLKNYRDRVIELDVEPSEELTVHASEAELKQVMLNLTINALEAVEPITGQVTISAGRRGNCVEISVTDNGRGMAPDVLDRVFEPFFTQRRTGDRRGVGLGLAITHAIVEAHGGHVRAESDGPGRGSRFIVELPVHHETPSLEHAGV